MICNAHYVNDNNLPGFAVDDNASDIIDAFKQGKHVCIRFVATNESSDKLPVDEYYTIVGYQEADIANSISEIIYMPQDFYEYSPFNGPVIDNNQIFFSFKAVVAM